MGLLNALPQDPVGETPYSKAVIDHLLGYQGRGTYWPGDSEVRSRLVDQKIRPISLVLEALENAMMRGKNPGNPKIQDGLPVEHLMPQTPTENDWPIPINAEEDPEGAQAFEKERIEAIQRLGNLTLINNRLNSSISNGSWVKKRSEIQKNDNLFLNKELLSQAPNDNWDEEQIRLRGKRLAEYVLKIWPHGHAVTHEMEKVYT